MRRSKNRKYAIDEDIRTTGLASTDFIQFECGAQDSTIIQEINSSTDPVVLFTGNAQDFKRKLDEDHQLVGVSRESIPSNNLDDCILKAVQFIEKKTGTRKHRYLHLSTTEGKLVLVGSPSTKNQQIFKIS